MSHFAKVENGVVTQVIVAEKEDISALEGIWLQTSYNTTGNQHTKGGTPLRGNYAGVGYTYDATNDVFYSPSPYSSWILNYSTWSWEAPIPVPTSDRPYMWDEENTTWIEV